LVRRKKKITPFPSPFTKCPVLDQNVKKACSRREGNRPGLHQKGNCDRIAVQKLSHCGLRKKHRGGWGPVTRSRRKGGTMRWGLTGSLLLFVGDFIMGQKPSRAGSERREEERGIKCIHQSKGERWKEVPCAGTKLYRGLESRLLREAFHLSSFLGQL